jgi:hypothetical protein
MYVLGGFVGATLTTSVLKFDSMLCTWSEVAPMPAIQGGLAACACGSDIYIFGGYSDTLQDQRTVFKFDTEANEWNTLAPMPIVGGGHSASVLDGLVYIVGYSATLRFDPVSGAWSTLAPTLSDRQSGASFVLGGCLYVCGGGDDDASAERYDVATNMWSNVVAEMLEGRSHFCAVTIGSTGPAEEQNLFDSLIAKASKIVLSPLLL